MRLAIVLLTAVSALAAPAPVRNQHPRIWITPASLAEMRQEARRSQSRWLEVKKVADRLLEQPVFRLTITAAANSNPAQFTMAEPIPFSSTAFLFFGGASAPWAAINTPNTSKFLRATRVSGNVISLPIDSTTFGTFDPTGVKVFCNCTDGKKISYPYEGKGWYDALSTLALAYQVSGNAAYASKALELIDSFSSLASVQVIAPEAIDGSYPSRNVGLGLALAYDWLYDQFSDSEKAAVVSTANAWFDWCKVNGYRHAGPADSNYWGGHILGLSALGYATYGDNPRAQEIIDWARSNWNTQMALATGPGGGLAGGYPEEGYSYGGAHLARLLEYMLMIQTVTGEDLFSSTNFAQTVAKSLIYNRKPNRWQVIAEGTQAGSFSGFLATLPSLVLSHALSGTTEGGWMQQFYNTFAPLPKPNTVQQAAPTEILLFYRAGRSAVDYTMSLPGYFYSPGDEHTYQRSDWSDNAVWFSFCGASSWHGDHQDKAWGHIDLQRGADYLLVDSQEWKGKDGLSGRPEMSTQASGYASTLYFDDHGEYAVTGPRYVGGQGFWGGWKPTLTDLTGNYVYASADLTDAYRSNEPHKGAQPTLQSFVRTVAGMGDGTFFVFDRVQALKSTYRKAIRFQLNPVNGAPVVERHAVRSVVGKSVLYIMPLLPTGPAIEVAQNEGVLSYHADISSVEPARDLTALTVLYAGARSASRPDAVLLDRTADAYYGAQIGGPTPKAVLFPGDGRSHDSVTFAIAGGTPVKILVTGLRAGQYEIRQNGTPLGAPVTAGTAGTLFFTRPGGSFEIRRR